MHHAKNHLKLWQPYLEGLATVKILHQAPYLEAKERTLELQTSKKKGIKERIKRKIKGENIGK